MHYSLVDIINIKASTYCKSVELHFGKLQVDIQLAKIIVKYKALKMSSKF